MISRLEKAGKNGIDLLTFINELTYSWGYGRKIVKKDILELVELKKAKISGTRIYHSMFLTGFLKKVDI